MFDTLTRMGASNPSGYEIERSLRWNPTDSTYLSKTPSSASNRRTYTLSVWLKASGGTGRIYEAGSAHGMNGSAIYYDAGKFGFIYDAGATWYVATTTSLHRDPASWYHFVCQIDTTDGTAADRVQFWVNNVRQPVFYEAVSGTYMSQNLDTHLNNNIHHSIGRRSHQNDNYFDG